MRVLTPELQSGSPVVKKIYSLLCSDCAYCSENRPAHSNAERLKAMDAIELLLDSTENLVRNSFSSPVLTSSRAWLEVGAVMSRGVNTISADQTTVSAAKVMSERNVSCLVILDNDGEIVGIVTETDFLKRVAKKDTALKRRRISEIMSSPVKSAPASLSVLEAAAIMEEMHIKRLPIVDDKRLVGIATQTDLVRALTSFGVQKSVSEVMTRHVTGIQRNATVAEAAELMASCNISCLVALEQEKAAGIFTERDLLRKVIAKHKDPVHTPMEEIMSSPVLSVRHDESVFSASRTMHATNVRRLVVTENGRPCGMISQTDIFRAAKSSLEAEEDTIKTVLATQDIAMLTLAKVAESRDGNTGEHLLRLRSYSQILATHLSQKGPHTGKVDQQFLDNIYRSSPLHDIGKVGISDAILLNPGRFTPEEFEEMKRHAVIGANTLEEAVLNSPSGSFLAMAAVIARFHHERFDGSGYPAGLTGTDIPLPARIVAVADVFDALTSSRTYKDAYETEKARQIIEEGAGTHFDPVIVDAFSECFDEIMAVWKEYGERLPVAVGAMAFAEHD